MEGRGRLSAPEMHVAIQQGRSSFSWMYFVSFNMVTPTVLITFPIPVLIYTFSNIMHTPIALEKEVSSISVNEHLDKQIPLT